MRNREKSVAKFRNRFAGYDLETCLREAEVLNRPDTILGMIVQELIGRLRESHRVKMSALEREEALKRELNDIDRVLDEHVPRVFRGRKHDDIGPSTAHRVALLAREIEKLKRIEGRRTG